MFLSRQEKEKLVIDLYYNQGKTFRDIAKEVRTSFSDISFILKKKEAEEEEKNKTSSNTNHQEQLSLFAKAYKLYSKRKNPVQVAINLNIQEAQATQFYREYWKLRGLHKLNYLYEKTNGEIFVLLELYKNLIENKGMSIEQVVNAVDTAANKLPYMEDLHRQVKEEVNKLRGEKLYLLNEVDFLTSKVSRLQETLYSLEQNCKRIEDQGMEELNSRKDIAKILVANVLNQIQTLVNGATSSTDHFNSTLSLPSQSSSDILPVQFNQSHSHRKKEESEEIYEMTKVISLISNS